MFVRGNLYFADVGNRRVRVVRMRAGTIETVAGGGEAALGDGGPATAASFSSHPMRVACDGAGNIYVADAHHHRIRKIDAATGLISTLAGNGQEGSEGDGRPATLARLASPHGAAVDRWGNLYVADLKNHRIRRIDAATGTISTIAGTGEPGDAGDGGAAVRARLHSPIAVDVNDAGDVYLADHRNSRARRVDAATGIITTVAGTGQPGYGGDGRPAGRAALRLPRDVQLDGGGGLIIADGGNNRIRMVDRSGVISTLAGNGAAGAGGDGPPAVDARLSMPYSIALDAGGNLYIVDSGNNRIRRVDASTGRIATIAGTGERGFSGDGGPASLASIAVGKAP